MSRNTIITIVIMLVLTGLIGWSIVIQMKQVNNVTDELCSVFNDSIVQLPNNWGEVNCTRWNAGQYESY